MSTVNLATTGSGVLSLTAATEPDAAEGVTWRAVFAGAISAAALSFILLILGVGLGLSATSPWAYDGGVASYLAASAIGWIIFTEVATRAQALHILVRSLQTNTLSQDDARYLAQQVSLRTGLTEAEAQIRVMDTFARAKKALQDTETAVRQQADEARKASAHAALWMFVALLAGAFVSA